MNTEYKSIVSSDNTAATKLKISGGEKYPVWIDGVQITSENKDNIGGIKEGTASYDPMTCTLTLNNVKEVEDINAACFIKAECNLTITRNADYTATNTTMFAIYSNTGNITIAKNANIKITDSQGLSIQKNLNVYGLLEVASRGQRGVDVKGNLDVSGTLISNYGDRSIYVSGDINITGTVEAGSNGKGVSEPECAIYANNLIFNGKSLKVNSVGEYAVDCSRIQFLSGTFEADAKTMVIDGWTIISDEMKIVEPEGAALDSYGRIRVNDKEITHLKIMPAEKYTVSFDMKGHGTPLKSQTVIEGKLADEPEKPAEKCCIFEGWYIDEAYTTEYDFNTPVNNDTVIYAKWTVAHTISHVAAKAATCTESGNAAYYACSVCGKGFSDEAGSQELSKDSWLIPAKGHEYDVPTYTWSDDSKTCTANIICKNDSSHVITETVSAVASVKTEPTIDAMGVTTYTASFSDTHFKAQTKDVTDIPKKEAALKTDGTIIDKDSKYKVISENELTVAYVATQTKGTDKITIPAEVVVDGKTYKVTEIADNAFTNNKTVTAITVGDNVKVIGKDSFYGCAKLKTVTMKNNITEIKAGTFKNCKSLTKITIPTTVKKIGKEAFYGCKKLKNINIKTTKLTKKTVGKNAFKGIHEKAKVKVPKKKLKAYKSILKSAGIKGKKQKISK